MNFFSNSDGKFISASSKGELVVWNFEYPGVKFGVLETKLLIKSLEMGSWPLVVICRLDISSFFVMFSKKFLAVIFQSRYVFGTY